MAILYLFIELVLVIAVIVSKFYFDAKIRELEKEEKKAKEEYEAEMKKINSKYH